MVLGTNYFSRTDTALDPVGHMSSSFYGTWAAGLYGGTLLPGSVLGVFYTSPNADITFTSATTGAGISFVQMVDDGNGGWKLGSQSAFLRGTFTTVGLVAPFPGDANGDGTVNIADLSVVLTNYDKTGMDWRQGDFNGDGTVNISDLSNVLTNYDKTAASSAAGIKAVPEPSALLLAALGLVGLWAYAWRKCR